MLIDFLKFNSKEIEMLLHPISLIFVVGVTMVKQRSKNTNPKMQKPLISPNKKRLYIAVKPSL
jgi:hypothetical protein